MSRRTSKVLAFFVMIVLGVGVLNLLNTSAYRGINPFICRELAGMFAKSPTLLIYEDFDRLGDCVEYYKRIYSVMKRTPMGEPEAPKSRFK